MKSNFLFLYSRVDCCLCEGLEKKLKKIPLIDLEPPLKLKIIDIDNESLSKNERDLYDLRVPVLAVKLEGYDKIIEFPRVSPRLEEETLFKWLQRFLNKTF